MSTVTLFKNSHGNVHVALKSGRTVAFVNGKFFTKDEDLAYELERAARTGEFGIFIDSSESEIDPQFATPMDQLKKKLRDELLAELAAEGKLVKDAGVSQQQPLQLQSSNSVAGQAALTEEQRALQEKQRAELEGKDTGETIGANENTGTTAQQPNPATQTGTTAEPGIAQLSAAEQALAKLKKSQ